MRIIFTPPSEEEFKQLFHSIPLRKGGGLNDISVFQPYLPSIQRHNRKGAGFFSFISGIAKNVLPFLFNAAKPAAKQFGTAVMKDVLEGNVPIKKSLKRHGMNALKDTGLRLLKGSGRINKKKRRKRRGRSVTRKIKRNLKKKKSNKKLQYKSDIFSLV